MAIAAHSIDKVTEVVQQFGVVPRDELSPHELRIRGFRSVHQEVISPDRWRSTSLLGAVAEDSAERFDMFVNQMTRPERPVQTYPTFLLLLNLPFS